MNKKLKFIIAIIIIAPVAFWLWLKERIKNVQLKRETRDCRENRTDIA